MLDNNPYLIWYKYGISEQVPNSEHYQWFSIFLVRVLFCIILLKCVSLLLVDRYVWCCEQLDLKSYDDSEQLAVLVILNASQ